MEELAVRENAIVAEFAMFGCAPIGRHCAYVVLSAPGIPHFASLVHSVPMVI